MIAWNLHFKNYHIKTTLMYSTKQITRRVKWFLYCAFLSSSFPTGCIQNVKHLPFTNYSSWVLPLYLCAKKGFRKLEVLEKTLISSPSPPYLGVVLTLEAGMSCGRSEKAKRAHGIFPPSQASRHTSSTFMYSGLVHGPQRTGPSPFRRAHSFPSTVDVFLVDMASALQHCLRATVERWSAQATVLL